ncbi:phosphatidylglycerophosphatase A [Thiomicrorhabdus sp.]|uniref:phosphatidylglycerophosphatase A family protein n=1 Tax=Thiomicrorhabdus sp. TaxID=2039724 RepID=UPI003567BFB5
MAQSTPTFKELIQSPALLLGFGFGSGLASKGPGTFGTLLGLLLFLPILVWSETLAWTILAISTVAGIWICDRASKILGVHDHGGIVWDEFVGIWLVLLCLPEQNGWYWLFAFVAFRIFDIAKPWPISWADRSVSGGFGIMLDDVLAAVVAIGFIWASTISFNWLF